jgi:hypothetical protein
MTAREAPSRPRTASRQSSTESVKERFASPLVFRAVIWPFAIVTIQSPPPAPVRW